MSALPEQFMQGGSTDQMDPDFFVCSNTYLDIANQQARKQGLRRVSAALLYAAARYNVHAYLGFETDVKGTREDFMNYMTDLYRRMLDEHLASFAAERGLDIGRDAATAAESADAG